MATRFEVTDTVTELEFQICDDNCLFVELSGAFRCHVELEEVVHQSDGSLLEYFTVRGAEAEQVLSAADDSESIAEARLIRETNDELLFQFVVSSTCAIATLADKEAIVRVLYATNGDGHVIADVPAHVVAQHVVDAFRERHPDSSLVARRTSDRSSPEFTESEFRLNVVDSLTDRQREALHVAYKTGYFDWPREKSATECGEALGVAQSTFSQHLRTGERKVLGYIFDGLHSYD